MAELAASIIGIVSAGTKVTLVLSQLSVDVGSAGKEARMIGNEIRSFCAVVKTLGETLEKVQSSQYYAHCAEMTKDMTDASLEIRFEARETNWSLDVKLYTSRSLGLTLDMSVSDAPTTTPSLRYHFFQTPTGL